MGRSAWIEISKSLLYVLIWSALFIIPPYEYEKQHTYDLETPAPQDCFRIVLHAVGILSTLLLIIQEIYDYWQSQKKHTIWKLWREQELQKDLAYCHPRWPEEKLYLKQEVDELDNTKPSYFNDVWNIFDWVCFLLLLICSIIHAVDVITHDSEKSDWLAELYSQMSAVTIIIIWIRLLKNVRVYGPLGPFIVMMGKIVNDVLKFFFLYLEFVLPFSVAFWIIFGAAPRYRSGLPKEWKTECDSMTINGEILDPLMENCTKIPVEGMLNYTDLLYTMFRITLVDDYDFSNMLLIDPIMARLLCGFFLGISAILILNMLIALLSDTFQRVYDNAKANALMERARFIVASEDALSNQRLNGYRNYIHQCCSPLGLYYDDDNTEQGSEDLLKVTVQIKNQIEEMQEEERRRTEKRTESQALLRDLYSTFMRRTAIEDELRRQPPPPPPPPPKVVEKMIACDHKNELQEVTKNVMQIQAHQKALTQRYQADMTSVLSLLRSMAPAQPIKMQGTMVEGHRTSDAVFDGSSFLSSVEESGEDQVFHASEAEETSPEKRKKKKKKKTRKSGGSQEREASRGHSDATGGPLPLLDPFRNETLKTSSKQKNKRGTLEEPAAGFQLRFAQMNPSSSSFASSGVTPSDASAPALAQAFPTNSDHNQLTTGEYHDQADHVKK